jgi:predicted transposase/invertase (TIGR01784 family)
MEAQSVIGGGEPERLNLLWDNVFKAVFTREEPASREALRQLVSAQIERDAQILKVVANEPAVSSITERQIRYDITCEFNDGEKANIEMTLYPDKNEALRMEYYSCKLFTSQDIRGAGKGYKGLCRTYQISFLVNHDLYDDKELIHQFEYYDHRHGTSLGGRSAIITVELGKVDTVAAKAVSEMSAAESWAVYFRYNADETKRGLLEAISEKNKGVAMAQEVFLTVSRDEQERARLLSEYKFVVDLQSRMITAEEDGFERGTVKGRDQVLDLLKQQGYNTAEIERQLGM